MHSRSRLLQPGTAGLPTFMPLLHLQVELLPLPEGVPEVIKVGRVGVFIYRGCFFRGCIGVILLGVLGVIIYIYYKGYIV